MCFFSHSGCRPFINLFTSLGNLLLDITLCSISFRCRFVFFVNFRVRIRVRVRVSYSMVYTTVIGLAFGFGFGIGI